MSIFQKVTVEPVVSGLFRIRMMVDPTSASPSVDLDYPPPIGSEQYDANVPGIMTIGDITADDLEMIMMAVMEHRYILPHRPIGPCEPRPALMSFPGIPGDRPIEEICAEFGQQELPDEAAHYEGQEMKALRMASKEIAMLRDAVRRRNEIIEGLNEKQRGHKAEIVELHSIRRRLQAEIKGLERTDTDVFTQEQREFLWLAEESAEVIKAILKGLRFGMNNNHPARITTNRTAIAEELGHVHGAVTRLTQRPSLDAAVIAASCIEKRDARIPGVDADPINK